MSLVVKAATLGALARTFQAENDRLKEIVYPPKLSGAGRVFTVIQIRNLIFSHPYLKLQAIQVEVLDTDLLVCPMEDTDIIYAYLKKFFQPYIPERRDCEDFGLFMATNAAMVFGVNPYLPFWDYQGRHFYDLIIDPAGEGSLVAFEPQTGEKWIPGEPAPNPEIHPMKNGLIYGF